MWKTCQPSGPVELDRRRRELPTRHRVRIRHDNQILVLGLIDLFLGDFSAPNPRAGGSVHCYDCSIRSTAALAFQVIEAFRRTAAAGLPGGMMTRRLTAEKTAQ